MKIGKRKVVMEMWEVPSDKLKIQLPEGFRLMEDTDFVYLFYGDKQVAGFSGFVVRNNPSEIERRANSFLESQKKSQ